MAIKEIESGTEELQQMDESDVLIGRGMVYVRAAGLDCIYRIESIRDTFERLADELNHGSWSDSDDFRRARKISENEKGIKE